jgi:hypothetical protein
MNPVGWLPHHAFHGNALILVLQAGGVHVHAAGDDDDGDKEPCFLCESQLHASSDCPRREKGAEAWMHTARRAFENRQVLRNRRACGRESSSTLDNNSVREAAGKVTYLALPVLCKP